MFQVIRTDKLGRISGEIYDSPLEAIGRFLADAHEKNLYAEVFFRKWNQLVITPYSDKLKLVYIGKLNNSSDWMVTFSCEGEDTVDTTVSKLKVSKGFTGKYYSDYIVVSVQSGKIIGEIHQ